MMRKAKVPTSCCSRAVLDPVGLAEAAQLMGSPVTAGILASLGGQAVILDAQGRLLASSEDALPALGLHCALPAGASFPSAEALDLAGKGFSETILPVPLGPADGQMRIYRDLRDRMRLEALGAVSFEDIQGALAELARHLGSQSGLAGIGRLQSLAAGLQDKLAAQQQRLASRDWLASTAGGGAFPEARFGLPSLDERDTILVVDDSVMVLRLLQVILGEQNYRVVTADSGKEGLALAQEYLPDLILLDAVMPDLNGFEVCSRLKASPATREIPVLFVTALRGEADEVSALDAGAIDFIPKPITPAIVVARVRNHLELKHSKDRLRTLSLVDGLTGIANRRQFDQALEQEWLRCGRSGRPLSLVMGDVDQFKRFNDSLGHAEGDDCLCRVAQVFRQALRRPGDVAARYGGEEFTCILPDTDEEGAHLVGTQILEGLAALRLKHPDSDVSPWVTLSLGVATVYPGLAGQAGALVEAADGNLYEAKRRGRNGLVQGTRNTGTE
jgi:diguanylate cyclase (GGDEF)-like protein